MAEIIDSIEEGPYVYISRVPIDWEKPEKVIFGEISFGNPPGLNAVFQRTRKGKMFNSSNIVLYDNFDRDDN